MQSALFVLGSFVRSTGVCLNELGYRLQGNFAYAESVNRHRRFVPLKNKKPDVDHSSFVAPNASVIGDVKLGLNSSVWYGTVLRGDVNSISVGNYTSIGDNCVIHCSSGSNTTGAHATVVGDNVIVGENAVLHGCELKDGARVGPGAIIMDGAVVESGAAVDACAILTAGKTVPAGQLWGGAPARHIRDLSDADSATHVSLVNAAQAAASTHREEHNLSPQARRERAEQRDVYTPEPEKVPQF